MFYLDKRTSNPIKKMILSETLIVFKLLQLWSSNNKISSLDLDLFLGDVNHCLGLEQPVCYQIGA